MLYSRNISTFGLGFGFVEFENAKAGTVHLNNLHFSFYNQDAEDAVHMFNGKPFMGVK